MENPKKFLPQRPVCPNDHTHKPSWNAHWERELCLDHVHTMDIVLFNAYCRQCQETISYWPEFVLPYQREPAETHEQVLIEHLQGVSLRACAAKIGYDPRTLARWLSLIITQASELVSLVISRILLFYGQEILPLSTTGFKETVMLLLAWLHQYGVWVGFPRLSRLMGLGNILGQGDWDIWGGPLGNAKSRVKTKHSPD